MNKEIHYLVETDILAEHLTHQDFQTLSWLEQLMTRGLCFTTVINASELFCQAENNREDEIIKDMLSALKVLGIHSRYSLSIPKYRDKFKNVRDAMLSVIASLNKLTIVSLNPLKYINAGLSAVHPQETGG